MDRKPQIIFSFNYSEGIFATMAETGRSLESERW